MRVAIVNQPLDEVLPPNQNSVGIWSYEVARRLQEEHDVSVYARRSLGHRPRRAGRSGQAIDVRLLPSAPTRAWSQLSRRWPLLRRRRSGAGDPAQPLYASRAYYAEFAAGVALALRRQRPEIVHVHNFTGFVPMLRRAVPDARLVLHMSCEWLSQLDRGLMARRLRAVDLVVGTSDHITGLVAARFPELAERCATVYNGVEPADFEPAAAARTSPDRSRAPRILFVGRVSPEKGVHDLVAAMRQVFGSHPDAQLDLIGDIGSLDPSFLVDVSDDPTIRSLRPIYDHEAAGRPYHEQLIEGIEPAHRDQVRFHGLLPYAEIVEWYACADVLVNPSYSESFGMTPVEAMACELPVVATRVGGQAETIVDGETGILVERGDVAALGRSICRLLDDPGTAAEMGRAGRRRVVDRFSWDRIARDLEEQYVALFRPEERAAGSPENRSSSGLSRPPSSEPGEPASPTSIAQESLR